MLEHEKINPWNMGYDRPSSKLIGFLKKHYGLVNFVPQNNNFVVFKDYFTPKLHPTDYHPKLDLPELPSEAPHYESKHIEVPQAKAIAQQIKHEISPKYEEPSNMHFKKEEIVKEEEKMYERQVVEEPKGDERAPAEVKPEVRPEPKRFHYEPNSLEAKIDQNKRELEATASALKELEMGYDKFRLQHAPWATYMSFQDKKKMTTSADIGFFLNQPFH
jgi:GNAT acetyltransferase, Mec-17